MKYIAISMLLAVSFASVSIAYANEPSDPISIDSVEYDIVPNFDKMECQEKLTVHGEGFSNKHVARREDFNELLNGGIGVIGGSGRTRNILDLSFWDDERVGVLHRTWLLSETIVHTNLDGGQYIDLPETFSWDVFEASGDNRRFRFHYHKIYVKNRSDVSKIIEVDLDPRIFSRSFHTEDAFHQEILDCISELQIEKAKRDAVYEMAHRRKVEQERARLAKLEIDTELELVRLEAEFNLEIRKVDLAREAYRLEQTREIEKAKIDELVKAIEHDKTLFEKEVEIATILLEGALRRSELYREWYDEKKRLSMEFDERANEFLLRINDNLRDTNQYKTEADAALARVNANLAEAERQAEQLLASLDAADADFAEAERRLAEAEAALEEAKAALEARRQEPASE